ncbi:MAG: hypothetical protein ABIF71_06400 [Planctomycetota bacterium]
MPGVRICIIGGGSAYMTAMFAALGRYAREGGLAGSTIVLNDIDRESVALMAAWGRAGAARAGLRLAFTDEPDLPRAFSGADFVISCIRPGGLDGRYADETIPEKHGELGIETVGVGGLFMALRTIPVVTRIAKTIRRTAPQAWRPERHRQRHGQDRDR